MVGAEAAEEAVAEEGMAPASADGGGTREGRRLWGQAEEDLPQQVLVIQRGLRRRGEAAALALAVADHFGSRVWLWLGLIWATVSGKETRICGIYCLETGWRGMLVFLPPVSPSGLGYFPIGLFLNLGLTQ